MAATEAVAEEASPPAERSISAEEGNLAQPKNASSEFFPLPTEREAPDDGSRNEGPSVLSAEEASPVLGERAANAVAPPAEKTLVLAETPASPEAKQKGSSRAYRVDRRLFYLIGMLLCIIYPVIAMYVITYPDCPLDALGHPIPFYKPPPECELTSEGEKVDPDCIDPPKAYARVENILYMCLANEFVIHSSYVVYIKVWELGGRSVEFHREFIAFFVYFVIEFTINAAPYHVQTFPAFRKLFPFLYNFTWPLWAAFVVGSTILIPFGICLAKTTDQLRRAIMFQFPGVVYFGVDIFNRTIFLPLFETMQTEFALLNLHSIISFVGELAITSFYGSIFLPATQKLTNAIAEFCYNVSYQQEFQIFREQENILEVVNAREESDACVLSDSDSDSEDALRPPTCVSAGSAVKGEGSANPTTASGSPRDQNQAFERSVSFYREGPPSVAEGSGGSRRKTGEFGKQKRRTRGSSATFSKRTSTFSQLTRHSRLLGSLANQEIVEMPPGPYVPMRSDGPDPLEFDKILCWFTMIWDSWRYLLIRTVLLKASSIWLFLLMVVKDFSYSVWHFAYAFTETRILSVIEGKTETNKTWQKQLLAFCVKVFQNVIVRPFFLTKFLQTTVWRTGTFYEDLTNRRLEYQRRVYGDPEGLSESQASRLSFRECSSRRVLGRRPTASEWMRAMSEVAADKKGRTKGFLSSWWADFRSRLVYNIRKARRRWREKDKSKYSHPIQHLKNRFAERGGRKSGTLEQAKLLHSGEIQVRYSYANEMAIIRHVPAQPVFSVSAETLVSSRHSDVRRPSNQSVFRRVNASWLSKTIREIQSLVFNRTWPRLLQKLTSSAALLVTEIYAESSTLGLLPSYQEVSSLLALSALCWV